MDCAPHLKPQLIQADIRVEISGLDRSLRGNLDLVANDWTIGDLKVMSKTPDEGLARESDQLKIGYLLLKSLGHESPRQSLHCITVTKHSQKYTRVDAYNSDDDIPLVLSRIKATLVAIDAGIRMPASQMAFWCGPSCEYYGDCRFIQTRSAEPAPAFVGRIEG